MKKPYQIESLRAVKRLEEMSADGNPAVQMVLPLAEMVGWLHKGVGELIRQAGLQLMQLLMEEEVKRLVGERSQSIPGRTANRWGSERGYCVVMGQKVPVERPRVRSTEDREVRLGSYEMFHRGEPLTETVWEKLMLGLTTRKYGEAVRERMSAVRARRLRGRLVEALGSAGDPQDRLRVAVLALDSDLPVDPALLLAAANAASMLTDVDLTERLVGAARDAGGGFDAQLLHGFVLSYILRGEEAEREYASASAQVRDDADRLRIVNDNEIF